MNVDVVCLTSPSLVFRALQARQGLVDGEWWILGELFASSRTAPIVTVLDGHPHTLSFCSAIRGVAAARLGVHGFGQSGDVDDLYAHYRIDVDTIVGPTLTLSREPPSRSDRSYWSALCRRVRQFPSGCM